MANAIAYGFHSLADVWAKRVTADIVPVVNAAIVASAAEHTRQMNALMASLATRTTEYKVRYNLPGAGSLQPIDQWGNPVPVKEQESYDVAFPILGGGTAFGTNRVSRAYLTVEEVNNEVLNAQRRDADWMRRHILSAILNNSDWTFKDDKAGNLTIKSLANGTADKFSFINGTVATDDHYKATASAIADGANPFPAIYEELAEHPENGGRFVAFIPSNLKATVTALTEFIEVDSPRVIVGANSDRVAGGGEALVSFGHEYLGELKSSRISVVEWRNLPSNYILTLAVDAPQPILAMREHTAPELQGLFVENHSPDGNLAETRFIRYAGFGGWNRTAAVVQQIGNASYQIPTGYAAPMSA